MPAIQSDAALLNDFPEGIEGDDNILNAFLTDPEEGDDAPREPSKKKVEKETTEETDDDETETDDEASEETPEDEEGDEDGDEGSEDEETEDDEAPKKKFADDSDETYVKIKVGEEEHEVKVSDLKRLWGQEASLTRKSQEVATQKQQYESDQAKNIAAYDVLLKRATERANEYRALPWTQLMKDPHVPAEQLAALQAEAQKALEDEAFLKNEITGFMQKVKTDQDTARRTAATECLKALQNKESPHFIKGWTEALYNDIRSFATSQGIDKEMVNSITDPGAIKILHMAMQFSRGKTKVVTKKVNKAPTKIVKNSAAQPANKSGAAKTVNVKQALAKVRKSGTMDDAIDAFLALDGE